MKNIYRIISILVVVFMLAAICSACGSNQDESASVEQEGSGEVSEAVNDSKAASAEAAAVVVEDVGIESVTLIKNEDDSVAAVAIEYTSDIDEESLSPADYEITSPDQSLEYAVTAIYTNNEAAMADTSAAGRFVIIELSENAWEAMEVPEEEFSGPEGDNVIYAEDDGTGGPDAGEDEEVSYPDGPVSDDAEEEADYSAGPDGFDSDAEEITSPDSIASGEQPEFVDEDLGIIVVQIDIVSTVDGVDVGASPTEYSADTIITA